ncbi:MAG: dihydrolipoamide acetyltransferase family protein [Limnochordia bacterium]|jgi:pyruvate dehydrogenase E2 component (dihydrolipoamide acetyltransferase)|nr:dihydrolipoamide acetyltransferase family protein [Bacillota bacterium]NLH30215.1 2-oxo acid dehydrogenase subunit E2 [Bacillota bacterium]HOB09242.1 dihydrolipoamide acetyltransferase family protein [Limnochordia bacterium]HPZ31397.1 dihydrolipoamide acetyltransferase family protein [Limnochordia bacterium]HQD71114.1 dihydrolipoamide acetyltransferase family protein [Limnochordia bacterium]
MATPIIMPRQGISVETCIITEWHKQKGDRVEVGDVLFSYETDKASFEEEAKESGVLLEIFFEADAEVPVLTPVGVIGEPGEDITPFLPENMAGSQPVESGAEAAPAETAKAAAAAPEAAPGTAPVSSAPVQPAAGELKISPRARNLAQKHHVDVRYAEPSGPEGRIIERDVQKLIAAGPKVTPAAEAAYAALGRPVEGTGIGGRVTTKDIHSAAAAPAAGVPAGAAELGGPQIPPVVEYEDRPLSNIRKLIAKAMHQSLANSAQLTLNTSFDATAILEYRQRLKAAPAALGLENITLNDIILFAVAKTLPGYPELNAHFLDNTLRVFKNVHLGIAVDTDRGLMVPTLFDANRKSLDELARQAKRLISQAKSGSVNPDELQGGTFTVTNLGTLGIESFTPILNPPQTGILGVCAVDYKVKPVDGEYVHYPAMALSLTIDHRAVDGAPAARFLQELKQNLENFPLLLAK